MVVDPFNGCVLCETCESIWADAEGAEACCPDIPTWRAVLALVLVVASLLFLLVLPLFL